MALTKVSTGVVDMSQDTGGLVIAKGTTAQQPTCDASTLGSIRENTTENKVEVCTSTGWQFLEEAGSAATPLIVDYLVVAGGGGGGAGHTPSTVGTGGGGGAGGLLSGASLNLTTGTQYNVTVGDGGVGASPGSISTKGGNSTFNTITSSGGGGGGSYNNANSNNLNGGSGGGAGYSTNFGTGISGQGNNGGSQTPNVTEYGCAGGGGAGAVGQSFTGGTVAGAGGDRFTVKHNRYICILCRWWWWWPARQAIPQVWVVMVAVEMVEVRFL